jgi:hypothetical protein
MQYPTFDFPNLMHKTECDRASARRPLSAETRANSMQYDGETRTTAISQNFFVGRFEITLFSQNAAG